MSVLGKFAVIMADPPWDIHMELPYGKYLERSATNLQLIFPSISDQRFWALALFQAIFVCNFMTIGGSKRGTRDALPPPPPPPPRVQIFPFSSSFLAKLDKIIGWRPQLYAWRLLLGEILDPPLMTLVLLTPKLIQEIRYYATADHKNTFLTKDVWEENVIETRLGTMSDDEMRKLGVQQLQDDGYIFLWVTGR